MIAKHWQDFERNVLDPVQAGKVQRIEMRRAFYAGAQVLFTILVEGASDNDEVTEADMQMMEGIEDELKRFVEDVEKGVA